MAPRWVKMCIRDSRLKAEPMLVVEEITVPKKEKAPAKGPEQSVPDGKKKADA